MKRQSLKLNDADWFWLSQVADDTGSCYRGKPSWRRLMARIARGELVVSVAPPKVNKAVQPVKDETSQKVIFNQKFPGFAARASAGNPSPFRSAF